MYYEENTTDKQKLAITVDNLNRLLRNDDDSVLFAREFEKWFMEGKWIAWKEIQRRREEASQAK